MTPPPPPDASAFLQDVAQQPDSLRALVAYYRAEGRARLTDWATRARAAGRVCFTGMGTSEFAPELILARLARAGVHASTVDAGELLHDPRPVPGLLTAISQSGESIETRQVTEARRGQAPLAVVVNDTASRMARAADLVLPMGAGKETAISAKTYVNTLGLLHLMAAAVESPASLDTALDLLTAAAAAMPPSDPGNIPQAAELLADTGIIDVIARGPSMAAARQIALTYREGTHCACTAFTGGAFRHGPFERVGPDHRAIFLIPADPTGDLLAAMAREAADLGSRVVAIAEQPVALPPEHTVVLSVPALGEGLLPLGAAGPQALLLDAIARRRGVPAGRFRRGEKVTRRE